MTLSVAEITEEASPLRGLTAAMGRRRRLCAVSVGRQPAADRSRYDVAGHGRAVDHRPSRGAEHRRLLLHHARPALDLDPMAGAGALCQDLCRRRLERAGGAGIKRDRGDVRAADQVLESTPQRKHDFGVRGRGAGSDRAASVGATACAGDAGHGGVGGRTDRGRRSAPRAVVLAAAADGAVGQSARRLCVRSGVDRTDRARRGGQRKREVADIAGAALGGCSGFWRSRQAAARPMAGTRCWRRKRFWSWAVRCR